MYIFEPPNQILDFHATPCSSMFVYVFFSIVWWQAKTENGCFQCRVKWPGFCECKLTTHTCHCIFQSQLPPKKTLHIYI